MLGRSRPAPILIAITISFLAIGFAPVHAATQYTLTLSPSRTQEQTLPGVALTFTVTGATTGQPYSFTFTVTDPSNAKSNANRTTVAPGPTFSFLLTYPTDFTGGSIKYVGQYNVLVVQAGSIGSIVASSHFTVGLTDKSSYQRTFPISIKADAYSPNETLTVNITHQSVAAPNFPAIINADPRGNLAFSWQTDPDLPTGNYTVTVTGASTVKVVRDLQSFWLYPTNVTVNQIFSLPSSLMRTQIALLSFSADYLGGGMVQSGAATMIVKQPDGTTQSTPSASYNATSGLFSASYHVPLTALLGDWTATVKRDSIYDGFGNGGPDSSPSTTFTVVPASLSVNLTFTRGAIATGNVVAIYSTITSPDGASFTAGTVSAFVSPPGRTVGNQVNLLYDTSQSKWVGSYTVSATDPSGLWVVQVSASDPYGNSGSGSTSSLVTVVLPPAQGSTLTVWFLTAFGAIAAALLLGFLLLKRKRTFRHHLQVDLQAVGQEASRFKNQEFFKSIKEQLEKHREGKGS